MNKDYLDPVSRGRKGFVLVFVGWGPFLGSFRVYSILHSES